MDQPTQRIELTPRELETLRHLVEGCTNRIIARRMGVTEHTAKFHINNLLQKFDANNRAQITSKAIRMGLIQ